jgi:hypothetical protein
MPLCSPRDEQSLTLTAAAAATTAFAFFTITFSAIATVDHE